jgi:hypothetical protein
VTTWRSSTIRKQMAAYRERDRFARSASESRAWVQEVVGAVRTPIQNVHAANEQADYQSDLSSRVQELLAKRFDSYWAIKALQHATGGEIYIFGGAVRRGLFGDKLSGDIDIMVPNGDDRAFEAFDSLKVPFVRNSQDLHRYRWNSLQIDLFQPREFFRGFEDVESALRFFDLKINALSLHLRSGRILDPFEMVSARPVTDPGINWSRWMEMSPLHVVILAIRLAKIMHELPQLTISLRDAKQLTNEVLPRIRECDWKQVRQRFPTGKDAFLEVFTAKVLGRVRAEQRSGEVDLPSGSSHAI